MTQRVLLLLASLCVGLHHMSYLSVSAHNIGVAPILLLHLIHYKTISFSFSIMTVHKLINSVNVVLHYLEGKFFLR